MLASRAVAAFSRARSLELATMFSLVASLVASIIIARAAGSAGRGEIVVLTTWAQLLGWAGGLSIDKALITRRGGDAARAGTPLAAGLSTLLSAGFLTAVGSVLLVGSLLNSPILRVAMPVAVLGTVAFDARAATLLVQNRWQTYAALRFAQPVLYLMGCAAAAGLAMVRPALAIGAFGVALCVSLWLPALLIGGLPRLVFRRLRAAQSRTLFAFAGAYHVGSVLYFINLRADVMMMPLRFSSADVGIYAVAAATGQLVVLLGSANLIRGLAGERHPARLVDRAGLSIAVVLAGSIAAAAGWMVPLLYGPTFTDVPLPARLLCVSGVLLYVSQGLNGRLAGSGRPWATALVNGIGVLTFVVLFPWADTVVEMACANVTSTAASLFAAWWLSRHSRTPTREEVPCAYESTAPRSCPDIRPVSRPSRTASSVGSQPPANTNSR